MMLYLVVSITIQFYNFSISFFFLIFEYILRNNLPAASNKLIFNKNSSNILFLQESKHWDPFNLE